MVLCRDQLRGPVLPPSFQLSVSHILYSLLICCQCKMKTGTSLRTSFLFLWTWVSRTYLWTIWISLCMHCLFMSLTHFSLWLFVCFFLFDVKLLIFSFYWFAVVCTNQCSVLVVGVSVSKNSEPATTGWEARPSLLPFPDGDDQSTWWPWENWTSCRNIYMF